MNVLGFLWDNLNLVALVMVYAAAVGAAFVFGGRNLAIAVATIGVGHTLFKLGAKRERDSNDARADDIERRREDAYREIDDRNTDRHDAADRLRKGNY